MFVLKIYFASIEDSKEANHGLTHSITVAKVTDSHFIFFRIIKQQSLCDYNLY